MEFLLDNPFVAFLVIYAIFRFFKGKKADEKATAATPAVKPKPAIADEARARAAKRAPGAGGAATSFEKRLEELARQFETKLSAPGGPTLRTSPSEPHAASGPQPSVPLEESLEAARLEIGSLERDFSETVTDPDIVSETVDYDLQQDPFEFHHVSATPAATAYHLDSFAGFNSASGTRVATAAVESIDAERSPFDGLLGEAEDMRRAFVLSEILGRPRSLRRPDVR